MLQKPEISQNFILPWLCWWSMREKINLMESMATVAINALKLASIVSSGT